MQVKNGFANQTYRVWFSVYKFYNPQIKIKVVSQKLVVFLNKILQNHSRKDEETRKKIVLVTRHEF